MPRRKQEPQTHIIERVTNSHAEMEWAFNSYKKQQETLLKDLRWARDQGETLTNLADALDCTRQWIYKWTTHGADHNRTYPIVPQDAETESASLSHDKSCRTNQASAHLQRESAQRHEERRRERPTAPRSHAPRPTEWRHSP